MSKPWYKTWWGIVILIMFWPFSLTYYLWSRKWNKAIKIALIVLLWVFTISVFSASSNSQSQKAFQEGYNSGGDSATKVTTSPDPAKATSEALTAIVPSPSILLSVPQPLSPSPLAEASLTPQSTKQRRIVKGSTPKGIAFYDKLESLQKQGKINGLLCTEFESDPVVDVNPDTQSVQLSLMYQGLTSPVNNSNKILVMNDFEVIKALAEQDKTLLLPEYGTLRLFVLTFHDSSCIGKGEVSQLMIDDKPEWIDWK